MGGVCHRSFLCFCEKTSKICVQIAQKLLTFLSKYDRMKSEINLLREVIYLLKLDFANISDTELCIFDITPVAQYYIDGDTFCAMYRPESALVWLSGCEIEYNIPGTGETVRAPKGSIVYLPEGSAYICPFENSGCNILDGKLSDHFVNFRVSTPNGDPVCFSEDPCIICDSPSEEIKICFEQLLECTVRSDITVFHKKKLFYDLVSQLVQVKDLSTDSVILPALEYIETHGNFSEISVAFLADLCGINVSTLRRHFVETFEMSPKAYINAVYRRRADFCLVNLRLSAGETAKRLGFSEPTYFSRFYKKISGSTPGKASEKMETYPF